MRTCAVVSARGARCSNPIVPGTIYCDLPKHRAKFGYDETWKIIRELYRHYLDFKDYCAYRGKYYVNYGPFSLNIVDLQEGVNELPQKQKEAFFYNVILDLRQEDVKKIMGITTVSVGQYVESACRKLAARYFTDEEIMAISVLLEEGRMNELLQDQDPTE